METASEGAPAVDATLTGAEDELVTLYRASKLTGIGVPTLWKWIETGVLDASGRRPRGRRMVTLVDVADVLAVAERRRTAVRRDRVRRDYLGDPTVTIQSVAAARGISEQAVLRAVDGASRRPRDAPQARVTIAKAERSLLDRQELAAAAGCSEVTVGRYRRAGVLPVERVEGVDLFPRAAIAALRSARAEAQARREQALAAARSAGTKPRRGELVECACGCGRTTYLFPYRLRAGRRTFYATYRCWGRHRWKTGAVSRALVSAWPVGSGRARQRWLGRWEGRWHGHRGGRPRVTATPAQTAEIQKLAAQGWGRRAIASRLLVSERLVRNVLSS